MINTAITVNDVSMMETILYAKKAKHLTAYEHHRILRIDEVAKILGCSKSSIYNYTNPKSKYYKADFPKSIKLSERSRGWKAGDIYAFINSLGKGE